MPGPRLAKQTGRELEASPEGMRPRSGAQIRGENRFSGRVGGKCLCEMTSAFIIKELRGERAFIVALVPNKYTGVAGSKPGS
jgi:hypothetical protein